jgi:hypothetical protein
VKESYSNMQKDALHFLQKPSWQFRNIQYSSQILIANANLFLTEAKRYITVETA